MSLPTPLNVAIERAIEALLVLDPDTRESLAAIDGKLIRIVVTAPSLSLALSVTGGKVFVVGGAEETADTTITGSASALRSLTAGNDALYRGDVSIEGDLGTGQRLKEILGQLDPDWEEFVSPLLGDSLTHRLGTFSRQFGVWMTRTRESLRDNTRDYLQEEVDMLAPESQVRHFCAEVDETRAEADRLEARVRRLERRDAPRSAGQPASQPESQPASPSSTHAASSVDADSAADQSSAAPETGA